MKDPNIFDLRVAFGEAHEKSKSLKDELTEFTKQQKIKIADCYSEYNETMEKYLDFKLKDINGNPIKVGHVIKRNKKKYRVVDRYLQVVFGDIFDNPRISVSKYQADGTRLSTTQNVYFLSSDLDGVEIIS